MQSLCLKVNKGNTLRIHLSDVKKFPNLHAFSLHCTAPVCTALCIDIPNTFCNIFRDSFAEKHAHDVLHKLRACSRAWYIFLFFSQRRRKKSWYHAKVDMKMSLAASYRSPVTAPSLNIAQVRNNVNWNIKFQLGSQTKVYPNICWFIIWNYVQGVPHLHGFH